MLCPGLRLLAACLGLRRLAACPCARRRVGPGRVRAGSRPWGNFNPQRAIDKCTLLDNYYRYSRKVGPVKSGRPVLVLHTQVRFLIEKAPLRRLGWTTTNQGL